MWEKTRLHKAETQLQILDSGSISSHSPLFFSPALFSFSTAPLINAMARLFFVESFNFCFKKEINELSFIFFLNQVAAALTVLALGCVNAKKVKWDGQTVDDTATLTYERDPIEVSILLLRRITDRLRHRIVRPPDPLKVGRPLWYLMGCT